MANPMKDKGVLVELDKKRHIKFDLNAFVELEEAYGSVDDAFDAIQSGKIKPIRKALFIGLMHEDEELTESAVGKMFSLAELPMIGEKIGEALKIAMPEVEEDEAPADTEEKK